MSSTSSHPKHAPSVVLPGGTEPAMVGAKEVLVARALTRLR